MQEVDQGNCFSTKLFDIQTQKQNFYFYIIAYAKVNSKCIKTLILDQSQKINQGKKTELFRVLALGASLVLEATSMPLLMKTEVKTNRTT